MESHDKAFFDRLMALTEENNKLLHKIRRTARFVGVIRVIYWVILVGVSVGAYYYLQPYLDQLWATYNGIQNGMSAVGSFVNPFSR